MSVWHAAKLLDARLRGHDNQEVIPAKEGIQDRTHNCKPL
jgi:hypothetical protein